MNEMIHCLIVDDEPVARRIISNYCSHLPFLHIVAECGNALEAKERLSTDTVDLLFLDIHMPVLNGIAFLNTLKKMPLVIFTTAYQEYAVNAFDLAACDYLVKPFSLERFIVAVDRAKERLYHPAETEIVKPIIQDYLLIRAEGKIYKILYTDCLYAEAQANYTRVVTKEKTILTKMSFTDFITLLPEESFFRVHRSFIINLKSVTAVEGNRIYISGKEVPVAANYKANFLTAIGFK